MDEQELFWKNSFGDDYTDRNDEKLIINNINLFSN